jgi:hypothetical protein
VTPPRVPGTLASPSANGVRLNCRFDGKAKILGLIIDRREVGDVGAFNGWTDEELVEEAVRRARALGIAAH